MPTKTHPKVAVWIQEAPVAQVEILRELRGLLLELRGVVEDYKWSRPCYSNSRGLFAYLHSTKNYVQLGFHRGSDLTDPDGLIECK